MTQVERRHRVFCPRCGDAVERLADAIILRLQIQRRCRVCNKHGLDAIEL